MTCQVKTALTVVEVSDTISADFTYVWSGLNKEVAGNGVC